MKIKTMTCDYCRGNGYGTIWEEVSRDIEANTRTVQSKEVTCKECNGKGYIEYPIFSVEEAKAILKHCSLSTES